MTITGTTTHNILNQNPLLTPLQSNGGGGFGFVTLTMAPLPGSPVIDKGNSGNSDQQSFQRPYDTTIPNAPGEMARTLARLKSSRDICRGQQ